MNDKQIWQTIALDLKRAANYLHSGQDKKAEYYLNEARGLYKSIQKNPRLIPGDELNVHRSLSSKNPILLRRRVNIKTQNSEVKLSKVKQFIKFEGHPEDILLGSSMIMARL